MWNQESLQYDLRELARNGGPQQSVSLGDDFISAMGDGSLLGGDISVELTVEAPVGGLYQLRFHIEGSVSIACDRCLAPMSQPIEANGTWMAQMGDDNADEDMLTASIDDGTIDLAWPIYEQVALAVPLRHVHPEGQCDSDMEQRLSALSVAAPPKEDEQTEPATAWKGIEKLRTIIKD